MAIRFDFRGLAELADCVCLRSRYESDEAELILISPDSLRRRMGGATRGGTAEPTSRDQNKRQERGHGRGMKQKVPVINRRKILARERKRRGRAERRLLRQSEKRNQARAR